MSLHLLRMLETRMEAAGIVLQGESNRMLSAAAAATAGARRRCFIAIWGGIVLLAIALPPNLRVPVLSGVVGAFVLAAVVGRSCKPAAWSPVARSARCTGSSTLKRDLEVLSRTLAESQAAPATGTETTRGARPMISPLERARMLDAEMQLQRAWLELNLRDLSSAVRESPWWKMRNLKLGALGMSLLKHRSLWIAAVSLLINLYRRGASKEKS